MEPCEGSAIGASNFPPIFQQHRSGKNNISDLTLDGSLDSGYLTISNNTPSLSSSSSATVSLASVLTPTEISTPERFSGNKNINSSNLNTIYEHNEPVTDSIKLTPVTQNIQNICNFHITTPKDVTGTKRSVAAMLNFQDFESTPKKPRVDEEAYCAPKNVQAELVSNTTPRKTTKFRSKKQSFRKKLKSAPDLDVYFNVNNIENEPNSRRENISPIFDKSATRGSRTPLSSSSSNLLRISTPKSSNQKNSSYKGLYPTKPTSVKKLLTFSDSQFEQLLGVGKKEDLLSSSTVKMTPPATATRIGTASSTSSTKKCLAESFVRASKSRANSHDEQNTDHDFNGSIRPLTFDMTAKSEDFCDISLGSTSRFSKKITAVTSEVLRDRELSRRHLSFSKMPLPSQSNKWSDSSSSGFSEIRPLSSTLGSSVSTKLTKKDKTETESQGFQGILNISNDCLDMEISAICTEDSALADEEKQSTANYNIPSSTDLTLNDSIVCEAKSPSTTTSIPSDHFTEPIISSSLMRIPRTPKKSKPISMEHERLELLYPMIRRTPSKYNPLARRAAATKRKSQQDLSSTFKRHCNYYGGNTYLNIIAKLVSYDHLLEKIFHCLTPTDLSNVCEVSKTWRQAVQSNRWAWNQVRNYLNNCRSLKENNSLKRIEGVENEVVKVEEIGVINSESYQRIPFNQSNVRIERKRTMEQNRSPPVSPSKRKFHENQKIVRTLAPNEKLQKCPRCNKSSRIYNALSLESNHHNSCNRNNTIATSTNKLSHIRSLSQTFHSVSNNTSSINYYTTSRFPQRSRNHDQEKSVSIDLAKTEPIFTRQNSVTLARTPRFVKSLSYDSATTILPETETLQYAECTGLSCCFRFCLECRNEYHPGSECKLYEPSSPSKDDGIINLLEARGSSAQSGKIKRRESLKRLCF